MQRKAIPDSRPNPTFLSQHEPGNCFGMELLALDPHPGAVVLPHSQSSAGAWMLLSLPKG